MTLPYVGVPPANPNDLVDVAYVESLSALDMPQSTVTSMITTGLAPYVTQTYVNQQAALNATKAYIDAADAQLLQFTSINVPDGAAGLDITGRIPAEIASLQSTQRFPDPLFSPSAYNTTLTSATTTEVQLYPISVAYPGYAYKLFITGTVDVATSTDGTASVIHVHQGSTTGPLVAAGMGMGENYVGGIITQFLYNTTTESGAFSFNAPSYATQVDVIALSGGGGGGGNFTTGTAGGATTVNSGEGGNTLTAAGGAGGAEGITSETGAEGGLPSPITLTYDGVPYEGAQTAVAYQQVGTGVGCGGGGGYLDGFYGKGGSGGQWKTATWTISPGELIYGTIGAGGAAATGDLSGTPAAGAAGTVWINVAGASRIPHGPVTVLSTPFNGQAALTTATTLYVSLISSGSATVYANGTQSSPAPPSLCVTPIPA